MPVPQTMDDVNAQCAAWKHEGKLSSIEDETENNLLKNMGLLWGAAQLWIGLRNVAPEGADYQWLDGTAMGYLNWEPGMPDDGPNCVDINMSSGKWFSNSCEQSQIYGVCKTVVSCSTVSTLDPSVCSGRGTCPTWNNCECNEPSKFHGSICQNTYCNGVSSTHSGVCSGKGTCVDYNTCNCVTGATGAWCEDWLCYGIVRTNSTHVCSGRGTCNNIDQCICSDVRYAGSQCEMSQCYGVWDYSSTVCSSHGACVDKDTCSCNADGAYIGANCQIEACYGVAVTDPNSCGDHGTCMGPNSCSCYAGYAGLQCDEPICGDFSASNVSVCSSHGNCTDVNICVCEAGYTGLNCEYSVCGGHSLYTDSASVVCGGHGQCLSPDNCTCDSTYFGSNCTTFYCNGIANTNASVCSEQGLCTSPGVCTCFEGYGGEQCLPICHELIASNSSVCSGNGVCSSPNNCTCNSTHLGEQCNIPVCFGLSSLDNGTCSGHGECVHANLCNCTGGYYGANCSSFSCGGIDHTDPNTCRGVAPCLSPDVCGCPSGFAGADCSPVCYDVVATDPLVCSSEGICSSPNNCTCPPTHRGDRCEITKCFGFWGNETSLVCNGHGACVAVDECSCQSGFNGTLCDEFLCFGLSINDELVCSARGDCHGPNFCECLPAYFGPSCNVQYCHGIASNSTSVCSGHGNCTDVNSCECSTGYSGSQCEFVRCHGVWSNDSSVCSGNGACTAPDTCECQEPFVGLECEMFSCFGVPQNEPSVCSSHGTCNSPNSCSCSADFYGQQCDMFDCHGVAKNDSIVCSSHGTCIAPDSCSCTSPYFGDNCDLYACYGIVSSDPGVCSGNGTCTPLGVCECDSLHTGTQCEYEKKCNGIPQNDVSVCSSRGTCEAPLCVCEVGYLGSDCEITSCSGILSNHSSTCGGHGVCAALDTCECTGGYSGGNCNAFQCFGKLSSESNVCSGGGTCVSPNECVCEPGNQGTECESRFCNGKIHTDRTVCNGHGICASADHCTCTDGYSGDQCEIASCFGIQSNSPEQCSSHGTCKAFDVCVCNGTWSGADCSTCSPGFHGPTCSAPFCDCLDRGVCRADMTCTCGGNFMGPHCRTCKPNFFGSLCNAFCSKESTCSNHGDCHPLTGSCECFRNVQQGFFDGPLCMSCVEPWSGESCAVLFNATAWSFNANSDGLQGYFYHPIATQSIDCALLIPSTTDRAKLGVNPVCKWRDSLRTGGSFDIVFGSNPTLLPHDTLTFDKFLNSSVDGSQFVSVDVRPSAITPQPVARLAGPLMIGGCNPLILDGSLSSSPDRRGLDYTWELLNDDVAQNITDLRTFLSTYSRSVLNVPANLISSPFAYHFRMNVTNFLGAQASTQISVTTSTEAVPIAIVQGGITRHHFSTDYILLDGTMEDAPCIPTSDVKFNWEQISGVKVPLTTALGGRRLIIDGTKNALLHDTLNYEFRFTVSLKSNPALASSATVTLRVTTAPLTLRIAGGSSRQIGAGANITFNTQVVGYALDDISCSWTCSDLLTGGLCPDPTNQLPLSGPSITITSTMLPVGNYSFTVTGRRASQLGSASVNLQVVNTAVPQIDFQDHPPRINRQEKLILPSKLRLDGAGLSVSYIWSIKEGDRFWTQEQISAAAFTPVTNPVIGFSENSFTEGAVYDFTVRGFASNGASGFSTTTVQVNESPKLGTIEISPASGQMMATEFVVTCSGWFDTDVPLRYSLRYVNPSTGEENPLVSSTLSSTFTTAVPVSGVGIHSMLTLVLYVTDSFGASSRVEKQIQVAPLPSDPSEFMSAMTSSFSRKQSKLDLMGNEEKMSMITLFSSALIFGGADVASTPESQALRNNLFDMLSSVMSAPDGSAESASSLAQRSDMILKLSSLGTMTSAQRTLASGILLAAATSPNLTPSAARDSVGALSNLFSSMQDSSVPGEMQSLFDTAAALTTNLANQQVLGQPMTEISTEFLSLGVIKKASTELEGSMKLSGHTVEIPSMNSVFGSTSSEGVAVKLTLNALNPFPNSENITSQIFSLSFDVGSVTQEVSNLPQPIILNIPGTFNPDDYELNVTRPGLRPVCRFWDIAAGNWSAEGGTFLELIEDAVTGVQYARCAFTHTTDFASAIEYVIPNVNLPDVTRIVELNASNMTALIVILSFLFVYVSLMFFLEMYSFSSRFIVTKYATSTQLKSQLHNKVAHSKARIFWDQFKKANIWIGIIFPPTLGRTSFTRSMMLTVIMVSIVGILVSNALTFGQKQANFAQVIIAAVFSDLFSTPFIIGFTVLFSMVKGRKKKQPEPLKLSEEDLANPFGDETLNSTVNDFVSFQEKQDELIKSDPWELVDHKIQHQINYRVQCVSMFTETNNINDVATPFMKGIILDESDEYKHWNRFDSIRDIFHRRFDVLLDSIDHGIERFVQWQKELKRGTSVSKLDILIFAILSLCYFGLVGIVDYCIISTITWLGERGAIIFSTLAIVGYFAFCVGFYVYVKYKILSMIPMNKEAKVTSNAVTVIVLSSTILSAASLVGIVTLTVLYVTGRWSWLKSDYFAVMLSGLALLIILAVCFTVLALYAPNRGRKSEKDSKKKAQRKSKEPGIFPWWARYIIYLLSWVYILAFSFLVVVYGIQFDSPDHAGGSAKDWILSSFLGLGQNVLLNKPIIFAVKIAVITSVSSMFNELVSSSFTLDGVELDVDIFGGQ